MIEAQSLTKRFGSLLALDGVSFQLAGPQLVCILGPNGAGKTTLLDLLEGLTQPDSGSIRLFGAPRDPYPRSRVGVVLQKEFVLDAITVGEYAELFAAIQNVPGGREKILREARLDERAKTPLDRISNGEAQRLFIAAATVHAPELLFLDEPTAHLDPESKLELGRMLRELAARHTVIMTTHDLREADTLSDHVLFLVGGKLKAQGTRAQIVGELQTLEAAFFHYCAARLNRSGEME